MTMPEGPEKQSDSPRNGLREFSILLLKILLWFIGIVAVLAVLAGLFLPPLGQPSEKGYYMDCSSKLILLEKNIYRLAKERKEEGKTDECSACDLIRDDLSQYGDNIKVNFKCSKDHHAYLIFPVSAYIGLYEDSVQPPVPVAMCHPGVHEKPGTPVLFSDGTVKALSKKEAEALMAGQSLQPAFEK
jgi:hypothetical protein